MTHMLDISAIPTEPNPYQRQTLAFRGHCNIVQAGGRGSSKTTALIFDILQHCNELGPVASVLVTRESWSGLQELGGRLYQMARIIWGPAVTMNKAEGALRLPNGANIWFKNLGDADSFASAQGRTYTMLAHDEAGNYPLSAINYMVLLRSNLRPPKGIRPHIHITANPMGRAHTFFLRNFIHRSVPWKPFQDEFGNWWTVTTSTLEDNPSIDQENYRRQLQSATAGDPSRAAAWIDNDWNQKGGGLMFGDLFDPATHIIDYRPPQHLAERGFIVGVDIGTRAPSVAVLMAQLNGHMMGKHIPGDRFVIDMTDTCIEKGNYSEGNGIPISGFAAQIKTLLDRNGLPMSTPVVVDNLRGLNGPNDTAVDIFREQGLTGAEKVMAKNRVGNWVKIRNYLSGAKDGDARGVWFHKSCAHLIDTIAIAPRDDLNTEDLSRHFNEDHAIDAFAIAMQAGGGPRSSQSKVIGMW
ncbi:MAG: hypothetical protein KDJ47_17065 [Hyphomicrobiaceae bacterium]|nr:hypothetical protein [Hyphomicrobiaceae bacterium]